MGESDMVARSTPGVSLGIVVCLEPYSFNHSFGFLRYRIAVRNNNISDE
jgi:hypothetical protein